MLVLGLVDVPWWGILILLFIAFLMYDCRDFDYFKKQGVPGPRVYPIMGSAYTMFTKSPMDADMDNLKSFGSCYGEFVGTQPVFFVSDEAMLSEIMVKQFSSFTNKTKLRSGSPIHAAMLIHLDGAHWKHIRNEISPTFTTGKLKKMNTEINRCAKSLADSLVECAKRSGEIDAKEYAGAYTMDVIASTLFGIQVDSQTDRNNAYIAHARESFEFNPVSLLVILPTFFPKLTNFLLKMGLPLKQQSDSLRFFSGVIRQAMEIRKSDVDQSRTDFLQLMMRVQRGENIQDEDQDMDEERKTAVTGLTTTEILANGMALFLAGYDTTSSALSFFLYNMAVYPDVQEKLVQEINKIVGDKIEDIDTSVVQEMLYLDQCVNENLRLYNPSIRTHRLTNQDVTINGVYFRKGIRVNIPIFAIHRDPKKWPNPDRFDPERFSPEQQKNRSPYHFLPFGNGPRICIGMRLALQELKVAIIQILRKVKVSKCHKTQIPVVFDRNTFMMKALGGIHLKVEPREQS